MPPESTSPRFAYLRPRGLFCLSLVLCLVSLMVADAQARQPATVTKDKCTLKALVPDQIDYTSDDGFVAPTDLVGGGSSLKCKKYKKRKNVKIKYYTIILMEAVDGGVDRAVGSFGTSGNNSTLKHNTVKALYDEACLVEPPTAVYYTRATLQLKSWSRPKIAESKDLVKSQGLVTPEGTSCP